MIICKKEIEGILCLLLVVVQQMSQVQKQATFSDFQRHGPSNDLLLEHSEHAFEQKILSSSHIRENYGHQLKRFLARALQTSRTHFEKSRNIEIRLWTCLPLFLRKWLAWQSKV